MGNIIPPSSFSSKPFTRKIGYFTNQTSRVVLSPFYNSKMPELDRNFRLGLRFAVSQRIT